MYKESRKIREFRRREQEILDTAFKPLLELGEDSVTVGMIADASRYWKRQDLQVF